MDYVAGCKVINNFSYSHSDESFVLDHFETTPPMSTFTFGFVISQLQQVNRTDFQDPHIQNLCIKVYARPDMHKDLLESVSEKCFKFILFFGNFYREFMSALKSRCCLFSHTLELNFL